ncbi:MAG: ABC transporter permease, partial [Lachnospiraceae bacterium]|nr:ABC transporter permease [Lachnospiraceae bacterium]
GDNKPVEQALRYLQDNDMRDDIHMWASKYNQEPAYAFEAGNVLKCWCFLILYILVYSSVAMVSLEFIDKDKR